MKESIIVGGQVISKGIKEDEQENVEKFHLSLACLGFKFNYVEISESFYKELNESDICQIAIRPKFISIVQGNRKIKGFEAKVVGIKKLTDKQLKQFFDQDSVEIAILSKTNELIQPSQEELEQNPTKEPFDWCSIGITGMLSGDFTLRREMFDMVEENVKYLMYIGVENKGGKNIIVPTRFEPLGAIEDAGFSL